MSGSSPRNIVVAVDDTEHSQYALQWALRCVVRVDSDTVYLVAVERPDSFLGGNSSSSAMAIPEDDEALIEEETAKHAGTVLSSAEKSCQEQQVTSISKAYKGDPRELICQACEDVKADILVVGSRGLSGLRRAFTSSVSHHCARYARCSVIVVHRP